MLFAALHLPDAHAQGSDYDLTAVIDEVAGDTVTVAVRVDPRDVVLGALEGSLVFDPDVLTPTSCDFVGDLGACNPLDDRLRFSALFLDGLEDPTTLLTVTLSARDGDLTTSVGFEDVAGFDATTSPVSTTTTPVSVTTEADSSNPLALALPIVLIAGIGGIVAMAARNRRR